MRNGFRHGRQEAALKTRSSGGASRPAWQEIAGSVPCSICTSARGWCTNLGRRLQHGQRGWRTQVCHKPAT